jgi:hypothetical protein
MTSSTTTIDPNPLMAAVTVQETAPGTFLYWIVHLGQDKSGGTTVAVSFHSPVPYPTADGAWAAGVEECKRVIAGLPSPAQKASQDVLGDVKASAR